MTFIGIKRFQLFGKSKILEYYSLSSICDGNYNKYFHSNRYQCIHTRQQAAQSLSKQNNKLQILKWFNFVFREMAVTCVFAGFPDTSFISTNMD